MPAQMKEPVPSGTSTSATSEPLSAKAPSAVSRSDSNASVFPIQANDPEEIACSTCNRAAWPASEHEPVASGSCTWTTAAAPVSAKFPAATVRTVVLPESCPSAFSPSVHSPSILRSDPHAGQSRPVAATGVERDRAGGAECPAKTFDEIGRTVHAHDRAALYECFIDDPVVVDRDGHALNARTVLRHADRARLRRDAGAGTDVIHRAGHQVGARPFRDDAMIGSVELCVGVIVHRIKVDFRIGVDRVTGLIGGEVDATRVGAVQHDAAGGARDNRLGRRVTALDLDHAPFNGPEVASVDAEAVGIPRNAARTCCRGDVAVVRVEEASGGVVGQVGDDRALRAFLPDVATVGRLHEVASRIAAGTADRIIVDLDNSAVLRRPKLLYSRAGRVILVFPKIDRAPLPRHDQ